MQTPKQSFFFFIYLFLFLFFCFSRKDASRNNTEFGVELPFFYSYFGSAHTVAWYFQNRKDAPHSHKQTHILNMSFAKAGLFFFFSLPCFWKVADAAIKISSRRFLISFEDRLNATVHFVLFTSQGISGWHEYTSESENISERLMAPRSCLTCLQHTAERRPLWWSPYPCATKKIKMLTS